MGSYLGFFLLEEREEHKHYYKYSSTQSDFQVYLWKLSSNRRKGKIINLSIFMGDSLFCILFSPTFVITFMGVPHSLQGQASICFIENNKLELLCFFQQVASPKFWLEKLSHSPLVNL